MDPTERWSKRPHSTITQRNVDKELQRIKSLAVVSVLNKNFNKEGTPPRSSSQFIPTLSPSSSLTTSNNESLENSVTKNKSVSMVTSTTDTFLLSHQAILHSEDNGTLEQDDDHDYQIALAEKEQNPDILVKNSLEKETLMKRVEELQALYDASLDDLQVAQDRNTTQTQLVTLQDKLIQNIFEQLDSPSTGMVDSAVHIESVAEEQTLKEAKEELAVMRKELSDFKSQKSHYESLIESMATQLSIYDSTLNEMEKIARDIHKENSTQAEYIDTKVQTLVQKSLEMNKTMDRLQVEHAQEKQALLIKHQQELAQYSGAATKNSTDFQNAMGERSSRSSISSMSSQQQQGKKLYTARWKGNAMPPASPPPSLPLPPIPTEALVRRNSSTSHRTTSTLSEIYASTSTTSLGTSQNYKHVSIDAVGGSTRKSPASIQSELESNLKDAAYYKEFTDQLQERLSVSKEIDDLTVWAPSDYDEIQKKIESRRWSSSTEDSTQRADQTAFWKGMKKKLRV